MNSFRPGGYSVMPSLSQRYYRAGKKKKTGAMILQDEKKRKEIFMGSSQALFGMKNSTSF